LASSFVEMLPQADRLTAPALTLDRGHPTGSQRPARFTGDGPQVGGRRCTRDTEWDEIHRPVEDTVNRKISIAALGTAGVLALGAGVPVLAASSDSTPSPGSSATQRDTLREDFEERRVAAQEEFAERLADELGVDADDVAAALEKVRDEMWEERQADRTAALEERLDQAVEDGTLTRAQADAILEAARTGVFPGRGGPGGMRGHHGFGHGFGDDRFGPDDSGSGATEGSSTGFARI
jgi:hypothetical protein